MMHHDPDAPLVFLDFDGVIVHHEFWRRRRAAGLEHDMNAVDPVACAELTRIVKVTGAKVVISSTWRKLHTLDELRRFLRWSGRFEGDVLDVTPDFGGKPRGNEIAAWRLTNGHRGPVAILDDDGDMEPLMDRWVRCSMTDGLTRARGDLAIDMLRSQARTAA